MPTRYLLCAAIFLFTFTSCASTRSRPCFNAGDTKWYPPITGNMECFQKPGKDGLMVNHGNFRQWHSNGKVSLEGTFEDGKKSGLWTQYDDQGEKIVEKWFEHGIERSNPSTRTEQKR